MTPEEIAERGHQAKQLLDNAALNSVFESILQEGYGAWLATTSSQVTQREKAHALARAIQALRGELQRRVDAAVKQAADIKRKEQRKKEI